MRAIAGTARPTGRPPLPTDNASLRVQHRVLGASYGADADVPTPAHNGHSAASQRNGLGRVRTPDHGPSVRVTVRLGLVPNSLAFWRRRRHGTASAFADALSEATGLRITSAYVRYWETAVGVPPGVVIEATSLLLDVPPTLIWTPEQLRSA